jgi:hypothetical protein
MSAFLPSSSLGLPASLDYKLPPSLSDDSKAYWVNIAPDATTSVSSGPLTFTTNTVATTVLNQFNSQLLTFTIPSGTSRDVFLDPRETFLSFRMVFNVTTAGVGGTGVNHNLIGSAQSFFDSLILYSNNIPIEQVQAYNLLANQLLNSTVNTSEKYGGCAVALGCDIDSMAGVQLPTTNPIGSYYYNFSIPLISVIGLNNRDHLFPIGSISNLQLQLQTSSLLPFSFNSTGAMTTPEQGSVTLDQFSLNMKYVSIGSASASLLYSTLPDGKYFMKSQTWVQSAANVPTGTSGQSNLLYQIRNSSVKSLIFQNSTAAAGAALQVCPNGLYDALNMAVTQWNVSIGGLNFPQTPLNPSQRPGQCFLQYMSALGYAGDLKKYGGVMTRGNYGASMTGTSVALTAGNTNDTMIVVPALGVRLDSGIELTTKVVQQFPNMHYLGVDLEKSGGLLFNGVSTRSSPPVGNFFINNVTPYNFTSFCWALVDCVLIIDPMSQTIQAFV